MFKNPLYLYGGNDLVVPAKLNFGEFFLSKLWEYQSRYAVINGETGEKLTFKQTAENGMNVALSLVRMGVRKGDVVAVCSENRMEFWSVIVGIFCTGAVMTSFNPGYTTDEMKHAINISKPTYFFCSPLAYKRHAKTFAEVANMKKIIVLGEEKHNNVLLYSDLITGKVEYDDFLAVDVEGETDTITILYSSGTTGLQKGVMLTHLNLLAMSLQADNHDADSKVLVIAPWYHVMGLVGCISYLVAGRTIVYLPKFEPGLYLRTIEKYKVQQLTVVPTILITLVKYPSTYDLSSVKMIFSGAAPLRTDTIGSVCDMFPSLDTVRQGYGMTESSLSLARSNVVDKPKVGSVGTVNKATTIKIVDIETRKPLGRLQEGEICAKGSTIMKGYVNKDRRDDFDEEGFYRTGDIGYYDEEGYLFVVGRLKELIKYKGHQVPPAEIEAVLIKHEGVLDAGVIGVSDDTSGEVPLAFVLPKPQAKLTEEELKRFVAERLSSPKHLRGGVRFVREIPRNVSGKILRSRLREMLQVQSKL